MVIDSEGYYKSLVESLRKLPTETEWVEFKCNNDNAWMIGEYISALSNSAALNGRDTAYVLWGIDDATHEVVGTHFSPARARKGNEELVNWLAGLTSPNLDFGFTEVTVDGKKVVVLEIPRATARPVSFGGVEECMGELKIPSPKVETADDFTRTKLYWYPSLKDWKKDDRVRTCYLAACYDYVNEIPVSNSVLRERFGIDERNKASMSRIIKETLDAGLIKIADPDAAVKLRTYIPYWA